MSLPVLAKVVEVVCPALVLAVPVVTIALSDRAEAEDGRTRCRESVVARERVPAVIPANETPPKMFFGQPHEEFSRSWRSSRR